MKKLFIFLNIILFLCVFLLFMWHFSHKSPPREKVLKKTPVKENIKVASLFKHDKNLLTPSDLALIADNDLFAPSRGVDPASLQKSSLRRRTNMKQLELTGICKMGSMKGAIITNTASRNSKTTNKKQFYVIDEQIRDTNYQLKAINPEEESVTISNGNSQFELKLERNDTGSLRRRKKGEADSKALVSLSQPKIASKPKTHPKPPAKKKTPVKPKKNKNKKSPEELRKIRQGILKKMKNRRNQTPRKINWSSGSSSRSTWMQIP